MFLCSVTHAQQSQTSFFAPADSFHKARFWTSTGLIAAGYTATVIGLNEIWYKQYPRSGFHVQDDWGEWRNVDKAGHAMTAYMYSRWLAGVARWAGVKQSSADWIGVGSAMLFQTTIEVMDGFSEKWGFSWSDLSLIHI